MPATAWWHPIMVFRSPGCTSRRTASSSRSRAAAASARSMRRQPRGRRRQRSRMAGSGRSPRKLSAEWLGRRALAGFAALVLACGGGPLGAGDAGLVPYEIIGDAIPAPLTGTAGDPARGRAIVGNRQLGLCLLCHSGPFPEDRLQGTLAPSLAGVASRLSIGQLRL